MRVFLFQASDSSQFLIYALEREFGRNLIARADRASLKDALFRSISGQRGVEGDLVAYEGEPYGGRSKPGQVTIPLMAFLRVEAAADNIPIGAPFDDDNLFLAGGLVPIESVSRAWASHGHFLVQPGEIWA